MQSLLIPCPKCGSELRLNDRRLLGRKGKCPKCQHRFLLQEPEEAELEAVEQEPSFPGITVGPTFPDLSNPPNESGGVPLINVDAIPTTTSGVSRLQEIKKRNAKHRNIALLVGTLAVAIVGGVVLVAMNWNDLVETPSSDSKSQKNIANADKKKPQQAKTKQPQPTQRIATTNGNAITLKMIPPGARILIHVRPAELWKDDLQQKEFRACLGPVAVWAEEQIKNLCLYEPTEVEELLIGLIPGIPGTPPDVTAVVHLTQEHSDLATRFDAIPTNEWGKVIHVGEGRSYFIQNSKTFAVVPNGMEADLVEAAEQGGVTSVGIEEILKKTDRHRHMTFVFEPLDGRVQHESFFPERAHPFFAQFFGWFGDEVETVAWSFHIGKTFHSKIVLRNKTGTGTSPAKLEKLVQKKLDDFPEELYRAVLKMQPQLEGRRQIVGRFPAMMKVYTLTTSSDREDRFVRLTTNLPERAAPNLALAALLTWDESTRTDFSRDTPSQPTQPQKSTLSIAQRLKKDIEIDFLQTPLHEAFAYIAEETGVRIEIDGAGLMGSGYTKNMEQNSKLGLVPANRALHDIIKQYEDMVLLVDEQKQVLTVTTKVVAEEKNLIPYNPMP
jgi:hypothetical protein